MNTLEIQLLDWQQRFVEQFSVSEKQRNLLIAAAGTGKTVTSLRAAYEKIKLGKCKKVITISDRIVLQNQWRYVAQENKLNFADELSIQSLNSNDGASITYQSLASKKPNSALYDLAAKGKLLVIIDEVYRFQKKAIELADLLLKESPSNQVLFISRTPLLGQSQDWEYDFGKEYLVEPKLIKLPETTVQIAKYSPSIKLFERLMSNRAKLDDLTWRQFEILISELLESDGYDIQLMSGSKDGGVDIIANKNLGELGSFRTLWQAKKYKTSRKIGISTIRELADVKNEFGASKAFIVTSSFLTSGALQRIERDKYLLGKVDRTDLNSWINRKLYE